jgi:hypothetical protein
MDVDDLAPDREGDAASLAPVALPTTRPRIVHAESNSNMEEDHFEGPPIVADMVDDSDLDDLDPELDELLTEHDLTAAELLEGEFVSEEMRRREC